MFQAAQLRKNILYTRLGHDDCSKQRPFNVLWMNFAYKTKVVAIFLQEIIILFKIPWQLHVRFGVQQVNFWFETSFSIYQFIITDNAMASWNPNTERCHVKPSEFAWIFSPGCCCVQIMILYFLHPCWSTVWTRFWCFQPSKRG